MSHIPYVCDVYYGFYRRYYQEPTKSQRNWLYSYDSLNISPMAAFFGNIATDLRVIREKLQDEPYPIGLRCILLFLSTLLPRTNEIAKKVALLRLFLKYLPNGCCFREYCYRFTCNTLKATRSAISHRSAMYITVFMDVITKNQRNRKETCFIPMIPQISPQGLLFSGILLQIHV